MICEPVDTADTSAEDANLPTISKSTAPYIACGKSASNTGTANRSNGCMIFPSVNDVFFPCAVIPPCEIDFVENSVESGR